MRALLGVVLLATAGCSSGASDSVGGAGLRADFEYSVDYENAGPTSCPARAVHLMDTSSGEPNAWEWQFPDGTTSSDRSPTLAPVPAPMSGVVSEVTLTVSKDEERDSVTKRIEIPVC